MELIKSTVTARENNLNDIEIGSVFKFQGQLCLKVYASKGINFVSLENPVHTWSFSTSHAKDTYVQPLPAGTEITFRI